MRKKTTTETIMGRAYEARRKSIHHQRLRLKWDVERIAAHHGITRARVYQILKIV